jgi:prepilin signal peptidase PulO-like enzyme (type II secretory pathway)
MGFEMAFVILFAFFVGLALGSFLNAFEYRLAHGQSIVFGKGKTAARSACTHCHKTLGVQDLIPVFSYVWLRGRCRFCHQSIHWQYPIVELAGGVVCAVAVWRFGFTWDAFIVAFLGLVLLFIFIYDLKYQLILDAVTLPMIAIAFVLSLVRGYTWQDLLLGAVVGGGFFAAQYFASAGRWIGGGDIRLGLLMGVMLGFSVTVAALFLAYLLGALVAVYAIVRKRLAMQSRMAFGTFLAISTFCCLLWGDNMVQWYRELLV